MPLYLEANLEYYFRRCRSLLYKRRQRKRLLSKTSGYQHCISASYLPPYQQLRRFAVARSPNHVSDVLSR